MTARCRSCGCELQPWESELCEGCGPFFLPAMKTSQLQPIETAPKDGTYILLFGDSGFMTTPLRCSVCRWSHDKDRWSAYEFGYRWNDHAGDAFTDGGLPPTHWLPLPKVADDLRKEIDLGAHTAETKACEMAILLSPADNRRP